MPIGLAKVLTRIRALAAERRVRFTLKAVRELAFLELDPMHACDILANLRTRDFVERLTSDTTGEWLYVFKPEPGHAVLYVKVIVRTQCVVVSFHEDQGDPDDDEEP
jgi:predicted transcriptional regulator of viral defense system